MGISVRIVSLLAIGGTAALLTPDAQAQPLARSPGLTVELTPYLWLPTLDSTFQYPVRGGGTADTTVSSSPGEYLTHLNFAAMLAGEVRYERFALLTDIMYVNANAASSRLRSFNFGLSHIPVDRTVDTTTSARLQTTVWTLAGGYALAEGRWGNIDILAGFRMLAANQTTNFTLSAAITRPDGSIALGRTGSLSAGSTLWNAIGGIRGRIHVAEADWFGGGRIILPFYFDVGTGGSDVTWQAFGGIGYQTQRVGLSIGYRYLSFQQSGGAVVQRLAMGGPILTVSFRF